MATSYLPLDIPLGYAATIDRGNTAKLYTWWDHRGELLEDFTLEIKQPWWQIKALAQVPAAAICYNSGNTDVLIHTRSNLSELERLIEKTPIKSHRPLPNGEGRPTVYIATRNTGTKFETVLRDLYRNSRFCIQKVNGRIGDEAPIPVVIGPEVLQIGKDGCHVDIQAA